MPVPSSQHALITVVKLRLLLVLWQVETRSSLSEKCLIVMLDDEVACRVDLVNEEALLKRAHGKLHDFILTFELF